jgi:hypothetical protein
MGYYPRDLNPKVAAGYHELSQFFTEYSRQANICWSFAREKN